MAKKLSVQTVAATARTLKKVAPSLSPDEERALRMRVGIGLAPREQLEQKAGSNETLAAKLAQIELMAFRAMGDRASDARPTGARAQQPQREDHQGAQEALVPVTLPGSFQPSANRL
jgi:hypothetical protein